MITIGDVRSNLRQRLRSVAGNAAAYETDCLLKEIVGAGPTELTLRHRETLDERSLARLESLVQDRLKGRPLAYLLGHVEFYGLDLLCDERALIPRPETEEVVDIALGHLSDVSHAPTIVDVGTGSANVAIAIAHARPDARVIATEIDDATLALARENAKRLNCTDRIDFMRGHLLDPVKGKRRVDLIVSNPPYIATGDPAVERSVHDHEPHRALYAGDDGLTFVKELIADAPECLTPNGVLVSEIGHDQGDRVRELIAKDDRWELPVIHTDLAGIDRILDVRLA